MQRLLRASYGKWRKTRKDGPDLRRVVAQPLSEKGEGAKRSAAKALQAKFVLNSIAQDPRGRPLLADPPLHTLRHHRGPYAGSSLSDASNGVCATGTQGTGSPEQAIGRTP